MAAKAGTDTGGGSAPLPAGATGVFDEKPHLSAEEVKEAHYRRLMAEHRGHDAKLAEIDAGRKAIAKLRTATRDKLSQAGYSLSNVDIVIDDSGKANRGEQQAREDQLAWMREMEGLPVARTGEQQKLFDRLEPTAKEEIAAHADGYNSGCIDLPPKPPASVAPILHPVWMKGYHEGQERRKWALAAEINVERDPVKAAAVGAQPLAQDAGEDEPPCETCKGDGTGLAADVSTCPDCDAEYEVDPALVH